MIETSVLIEKGYAKNVTIGEIGKGFNIEGLNGTAENFVNEDFCGNVYDVSMLNRKSKTAIGIMFDIVRKHITRGDKLEFHNFELPLVVSNNFTAKDFLELWGNVADEIYYAFGIRRAGEYVENTADHCKTYLDDKETYKTVNIFNCSFELYACLYSLSLDLFDEPQEKGGFKTRLYPSDDKLVPSDNRKVRDGKAEKTKTAENTAKKELAETKTAETQKELEETKKELAETKKEVAKKEEQLNKKAIAEFNDDALMSIADCIEFLIKKHLPIPADYDFSAFETDLFKAIENKWDLKAIEKQFTTELKK